VSVRVRPMEAGDVPRVDDVTSAAFGDLGQRVGAYLGPPSDPRGFAIRVRHLLATDPGGSWVAERDGELCGVALALVREGVWGLSLLVVRPELQSQGVGRELLARTWAYGQSAGARGFIILASRDQRALRSYVSLGLDLHPSMNAHGRPRGIEPPGDVRPWRPDDAPWIDEVDRAVRGGAHGSDFDALREAGAAVTVVAERGYVVAREGGLRMLAATDEDAATALLRSYLAGAGERAYVDWLTSAQQWAIRTCIDAGLHLDVSGAVLTGGELGPMRPYLPAGAYL
jgi:predicted N-acetyltransferase YhbS